MTALRKDLQRSVILEVIATQRQQLADQLGILKRALDQDDFEMASTAAGHVSKVARVLHENIETEAAMSRATVPEASTQTLVDELKQRAIRDKDPIARDLFKLPAKSKKENARVRG